jgi:hypothetical protein
MNRWGAAIGVMLSALAPGCALAGAWPTPAGETQVIVKYEEEDGSTAFDPSGARVPIPAQRDESYSIFFEHGLTDRLTLQGKAAYTDGEDQFIRYSGRGPIEIGLRYALIDSPKGVVSVYLGGVADGVGRNAGYALPNQGKSDVELRLLAGRSGTVWKRHIFGEVQVAYFWRLGLPNETHIDTTLGMDVTKNWLVLVQSYAGRAESGPVPPEWFKLEASLVRRFGPWSLQAGWRETALGRETPVEGGPVIGIWRRF